MSVPGLALLLTELHSSFPRSLCESEIKHVFLFHKQINEQLPLLHDEVDRGTIGILPASQMDAQAVLGRLKELVGLRHRGFPAWLCGI